DLLQDINIVFYGISLQFIIKVVIVTFFLLLFGEILPKIYATRNSVEFANFIAFPLNFLDKLLRVFSVPMRAFTRTIQRKLGNSNSGMSVDQLSHALDLA